MTWYLVKDTGDVFDHEETLVATLEPPYSTPSDIYDVMRENVSGDQLSAYNQGLIADAAMNQIEVVDEENDLPFVPY